MQCDICQEKTASVHYAEVINGQMKKMNLCEACAAQKGVGMHSSFSIGDLLGGFSDIPAKKTSPEYAGHDVCPRCRMTYSEFKKKGRLGCSACYEAFMNGLVSILEAIHKSHTHMGKIPHRAHSAAESSGKMQKLRGALAVAVKEEDFEKAAKIRDQIRRLEQKSAAGA